MIGELTRQGMLHLDDVQTSVLMTRKGSVTNKREGMSVCLDESAEDKEWDVTK